MDMNPPAKHMRKLFPPVFLLICFYFPVLLAQDYAWPTDASKYMTSSFCEFRPRHYHAAIDIKTWNQSGYKIFAVGDGYVYRLRVSSTGYGKAVYLKLKDGNFAIYAHLSGFTPELEAYADSLRFARKNNEIDQRGISPRRFPVKKGQHIGYTGETGIGVPHLHFEMRDRYNHPINPLQFYRDVLEDNIAPKPHFLAVIPAGGKTLIEYAPSTAGNFSPDTLLISLPQQKKVFMPAPIQITGRAYLALRAYDIADGVNNRFDFYRAQMFVNDSLVYQVQYDRFSYDETHLIELDKNFSLWRKGLRYYHNFYRHPANSLPFYSNASQNAGMLSGKILKPGKNDILLKVADYFGNEMELHIPVIYRPLRPLNIANVRVERDSLYFAVRAPERQEIFRLTRRDYPSSGQAQKTLFHDFRVNLADDTLQHYLYQFALPWSGSATGEPALWLQSGPSESLLSLPTVIPLQREPALAKFGAEAPADDAALLSVRFFGGEVTITGRGYPRGETAGPDRGLFFHQFRPDQFLVSFPYDQIHTLRTPPGKEFDERVVETVQEFTQVVPGKSSTVTSDDRALAMRFPTNALHDTLYVKIRPEPAAAPLPQPYRYLAKIYDVQPFDQPLNYGAWVSFALPDSIARQKGVGIYYFDRKKGWAYLPTQYDGQTRTFSTRVTSLEKFTAIQDTVPPQIIPIRLAATERQPLKFHVYDEFSGLFRERQIRVEINDRWSLFEFDPEEDVVYVHARHLPAGSAEVTITATDNAGNRRYRTFSVTKNGQ